MPMTASAANPRAKLGGRFGEDGHGETQIAVGAHLEQDAGQDDRAGGGRLHVGVGQPGVEGEERHLDGEGQRKGQEAPGL